MPTTKAAMPFPLDALRYALCWSDLVSLAAGWTATVEQAEEAEWLWVESVDRSAPTHIVTATETGFTVERCTSEQAGRVLEDWRATVDTIDDALAEAYRLSPLQASQAAALMALECEALDALCHGSALH